MELEAAPSFWGVGEVARESELHTAGDEAFEAKADLDAGGATKATLCCS